MERATDFGVKLGDDHSIADLIVGADGRSIVRQRANLLALRIVLAL